MIGRVKHHLRPYVTSRLSALFLVLVIVAVVVGVTTGKESIFVVSGTFAAIFAVISTVDQSREKDKIEQSKTYLDTFLQGVDNAISLIETSEAGNQRRIKWIAAARALIQCMEIEEKIDYQPHKKIIEIKKLGFRGRILHLFDIHPVNYYFGLDSDFTGNISAAAHAARANKISDIPEDALVAFWSFGKFPTDYQANDPLKKMPEFTKAEMHHFDMIYPKLFSYLNFRDHNHYFASGVQPRTPPKERT